MKITLDSRLKKILQQAHRCRHFDDTCQSMRYNPSEGHIPRGYAGGCGKVENIELIIIVAEPGDPHPHESYTGDLTEACHQYCTSSIFTGTDLFHRNLHYLLKRCFPGEPLEEIFKKTWITESVLCSADKECGAVKKAIERTCVNEYLAAQLQLMPQAFVITVGGKARDRAKSVLRNRPWAHAYAVAPPGCNHTPAKPSWDNAAEQFRSHAA